MWILNQNLTIVIPVREKPEIVKQFIKLNIDLLNKYPLIVINKSGGEELKPFAYDYRDSDINFVEARKLSFNIVTTKYILNLDVDTILPKGYVEDAIKLLDCNPNIYIVAIDYEYPLFQGHLAFGTSVGRTDMLKRIYNYGKDSNTCECVHMWTRMTGHLNTLPYQAKHLRMV